MRALSSRRGDRIRFSQVANLRVGDDETNWPAHGQAREIVGMAGRDSITRLEFRLIAAFLKYENQLRLQGIVAKLQHSESRDATDNPYYWLYIAARSDLRDCERFRMFATVSENSACDGKTNRHEVMRFLYSDVLTSETVSLAFDPDISYIFMNFFQNLLIYGARIFDPICGGPGFRRIDQS